MTRLRHARPDSPGITRARKGRGFTFKDADGVTLPPGAERDRALALAVPPAWTSVWVAPHANDHIQATGVDAAGRVQYIYHAAWRERMDARKFDRMLDLARVLPAARRAVTRDLRAEGFSQQRVLAGAFRLLDAASVRPGAEQYTDQHGSYGLTTLRGSHATVHRGDTIELRFSGKSGHRWHLEVHDPALAALVTGLKSRGPNARLFAWRDDGGTWHALRPDDINTYVRDRTRGDFTAKDFRTLAGTAAAALSLAQAGAVSGEAAQRRAIASAMRDAAEVLGNTAAVARASYVDSRVVERYLDGVTIDASRGRTAESGLLALLAP